MADNPHDSPSYRSASAKTVRLLDGGEAALREYVNHLAGKRGVAGLAGGAAVFGGLTFAAGALFAAITAPQEQAIPSDPDLSGKALLNRAYAYQSDGISNNSAYLLVRDNGRYELYQWIQSRERSELVTDFAIARQVVTDMAALTQNILRTETFSNTSKEKIRMFGCETLFEAANDGNTTFRNEYSCPSYEGTGDQIRTQYQRAGQFWAEAQNQMSAANYGPEPSLVHTVTPAEDGHVLETATDVSLAGLAAWAGLAAFGTAVSGLRRRAGKTAPRKPSR